MRAVLAIALLFAGCLSASGDPSTEASTPFTERASRPVVIALLDTGANPYEPAYHVDRPLPYGDWGILVHQTLTLTRGMDANDALEVDASTWENVEPGKLYAFDRSRLLAISFEEPQGSHIIDDGAHGTQTNYLAGRDAPNAILVMVQVDGSSCRTTTDCMADPSMARGMTWIADQPWIDVVSVSLAFPGNAPDHPDAHPEMREFLDATQRAAASGKMLVFGSGNHPGPTVASYFNGPPWIITVGGFEPHSQGQHVLSSWTTIDVVANYSDYTMSWDTLRWGTGTSYATPIVAATLASTIEQLRERSTTYTSQTLRDALNATAVLSSATDYDPTPPGYEPLPNDLVHATTLPILTQAQMGWGYVNSSLAPEIARRVLEGDLAPPPEKDQAIVIQAQYQRAREEYWANWPR